MTGRGRMRIIRQARRTSRRPARRRGSAHVLSATLAASLLSPLGIAFDGSAEPTVPIVAALEDPPYAPDSVFRPETHRPAPLSPPPGALLAQQAITGGDIPKFSFFGASVSLDGDTAVVGAPYADGPRATDAGAAWVFRPMGSEWRQVDKLSAPQFEAFDRFGASIAVSGSTVVVGADRRDVDAAVDAGAAFVYDCRTPRCHLTASLGAAIPEHHAAAGYAVAIDGDTIVVGAPGDGGSGAAHVFARRGQRWTAEATLRPPGSVRRAGFGHAVAISADSIVIGAPTASDLGVLGGSAYVYRRRRGWTLDAILAPTSPEPLARFGAAVAVRGDLAIIGAPRATVDERTRAGVAWVFRREGTAWRCRERLTSVPPRSDEEFGRALALGARWAVIGSHFADAVGLNTGGAQLYTVSPTSEVQRQGTLLAADARPMNEFSFAVAVDDRNALLGAPRRGPQDDATGAAYLYRLGERP